MGGDHLLFNEWDLDDRYDDDYDSNECDECNGKGYYFLTLDGGIPEKRLCICSELQ